MDPYDESLPSHSVFVRHVDDSSNNIQEDELPTKITSKNIEKQRQSIERFSIDEHLKTKISSTPPRTSPSKLRRSLDKSSNDDIRSPPPPPPLSLSMENLNLRSKFQDKIDNDNKQHQQFSNSPQLNSGNTSNKSNKIVSPKPFLKKGSRREPSALNRINSPTPSSKSATSQHSSQNNSPVNFNSSPSNFNFNSSPLNNNSINKINNSMNNLNVRNSNDDFADNEIDVGLQKNIKEDIYNYKATNVGKVRNSNEDILLSGREYFNPNQISNRLSPNKFNGNNSLSSSDRTEDMGEMSILIQTNRVNALKELDEFALLEAEAEEITSNVHIRSPVNSTYPNSTEKNNYYKSNINDNNKTKNNKYNTIRSSPQKLYSPEKYDANDGINDNHWTQQHRNKGSSYSSRLGDIYSGGGDESDQYEDDDIYNENDKMKSNIGNNQNISPTNSTRPKFVALPAVVDNSNNNNNDDDDDDDDDDDEGDNISNVATNSRLNDVSRSWGAVTKPELNRSYDEENNSDSSINNRQEKSQYRSYSNEYQVENENDNNKNKDNGNNYDNYDNRDEYFDNLLKIKSNHAQNTNQNNRRTQYSYAENNTGINMNNIIHSRPMSANSVKKNNNSNRKSYNSENVSRNQEKTKEMNNNDIINDTLQIKAKELENELNTYKKENINLKQLRKQQESALSEVLNQRNETIRWIAEEKNKTIVWCEEQKSLANKERRTAAKLARDSRQRANNGGSGNVSIRKEKQEIDGLCATIEKMKIDNELTTKKFRMTERRLNQLVKDQSININELNSNVNSLEKDKIILWTFLENSNLRIPNSLLKLRPKTTDVKSNHIKNNYYGDASYSEEVEVDDDLNFVTSDYVDTNSSHNDTSIKSIKSKYNYLDKKTSNIVYPKVRADNYDTMEEQINSSSNQFNLNSSDKKYNSLRISNSSSIKSTDSNEILLQQIISKESKLKKLANLENNLSDSWNRSSRSSRGARYSNDENDDEEDDAEYYYKQNNEINNKNGDEYEEEVIQYGALTESDNKISTSTFITNNITPNPINNSQSINKFTESNNFSTKPSPSKTASTSPSKISGFPLPSYFPNHKPSGGHTTSRDYIIDSDSFHNSQSFNLQMASNIDDLNKVPSPLSSSKIVKETKVANNGRIEETLSDGTKIIKYLNGTTKEVKLDGSSLVKFSNGDTKHSFIDSGMIIYYYCQAKTTHTTYKDGLQTFLFPNEQVERHYPNGIKEILFPDGTKKIISPDGIQKSIFPDGITVKEYPNGTKEIFTKDGKIVK